MSTKKYILELLESNRGQSMSGEYIAGQINVTRGAVWKAVNELKKDGYIIEATTNKGYTFSHDNDILSVQGMIPFLSDDSLSHNIHIHASLESTSKTAKELAISGAKHGTVVIANSQTAGKGRYGRSFYSPANLGLYMSFILRPTSREWIENPTLVTAFAAVSVCKAIEATTEKTPTIKWVNDIFIDNKKMVGILTEGITDFESRGMQWLVVGIGINFMMSDIGFPDDIKDTATALFADGKPTITRNRLAATVINEMMEFNEKSDSKTILTEYSSRLMLIGKKVVITGWHDPFEAFVIGIDNIGRLIVKKEDGETLSLVAGEIRASIM